MKWKAKSNSEAGAILKLLARQGELLLKKLDEEKDFNPLEAPASNDPHQPDPDDSEEENCESTAIAS